MKNIENKCCGYIRYFDITDHFPKSNKYKFEEEDLDFLKNIFNDKFSEKKNNEKVFNKEVDKNLENIDKKKFEGEKNGEMEIEKNVNSLEISKDTEITENLKKEMIIENEKNSKNKNNEKIDIKKEENSKNSKNLKIKEKFEILKKDSILIFEKAIEYLEKREYKELKENKKFSKINPKIFSKIFNFWEKKCKKLRRPLLRKNWKIILTKEKYGKVDPLKKAFHKTIENMNSRKNKRIKKENLIEIDKKLLNENKMALIISKLISYREKLKYIKILSYGEIYEKKINEFKNNIFIIKEKVKKLEKSFKKLTFLKMNKIDPTVIKNFSGFHNENINKEVSKKIYKDNFIINDLKEKINSNKNENYIKNKKNKDINEIKKKNDLNKISELKKIEKNKDFNIFMINTIKYLNEYGFNLNEFFAKNIKNINFKIIKLKIGDYPKQKIIKRVNLKKKKKKKLSTDDIFLIKRKSLKNPSDFYIEKIKNEDIKKKKKYNFENFINKNIIKNKYIDYQENYSHCKLFSNNIINPYIYNGKTNLTINDELVEKIKIKKYSRFFNFYEEENKNGFFKEDDNDVKKSLDSLNLKNGFKNFLKKKIKN